MRLRRWQVEIAATLIVAAIVVYGLRWILYPSESFHDEMLRYLVDDIAFLFIQVLLVSMLIDGLMQRRQRETMLDKLNMIVGAFFSECGTDVLGRIARLDRELDDVREDLLARTAWTAKDYERAKQAFRAHEPVIELMARTWSRCANGSTARRRTCSASSATRRCWSTRRSPTCSGR